MPNIVCNASYKKKQFIPILLGVYVLLVGFGLPLIVRDGYFDILIIKYYYYCFCTIIMLFILLVYLIIYRLKYQITFNVKSLFHKFTIMETFILLFWLVALISTLTSSYLYEAFWGNEGRYTGLFLLTWYILSYISVSHFWKFKYWYIDVILFAGILVCLFGITDYFKLDIFHFKVLMMSEQRPVFTSTLGNINTYTAYVGLISAISVVLFTTEKKKKKILLYYACSIICFFAIIMGVSDNAYLSLAALFGFLPFYLFKNKSGFQRYIIILATFFTVIKCMDWIDTFFKGKVLGINSALSLVISFKYLHFVVIALWLIVILSYLFNYIIKTEAIFYGNKMIYVWLILFLIIVMGILFALYDCNVAGNINRYSFAINYLLFNDEWGTHRGYIWKNAIECFSQLPFIKKLIGYGPETFGILLLAKTANNPYKEIFDSAHNEYLHTLVTVGILGLTFYVSFLILFIKNCFRCKNNRSYIMAIAFSVICYSIQAFVNLNLPITTPIFWLLIGMGSAESISELNE